MFLWPFRRAVRPNLWAIYPPRTRAKRKMRICPFATRFPHACGAWTAGKRNNRRDKGNFCWTNLLNTKISPGHYSAALELWDLEHGSGGIWEVKYFIKFFWSQQSLKKGSILCWERALLKTKKECFPLKDRDFNFPTSFWGSRSRFILFTPCRLCCMKSTVPLGTAGLRLAFWEANDNFVLPRSMAAQ